MRLAPSYTIAAQMLGLANGKPGVFQTLALMRRLIDAGKVNAEIRSAAANIIHLVPEKSGAHEIESLFQFVRDHVRYTRDVLGVETVQLPEWTLRLKYGDCDDQTVLFCALAESVGYPTRLIAAGYSDTITYEHVYAQVLIEDQWVNADCTERAPLGYAPPDPLLIWIESR